MKIKPSNLMFTISYQRRGYKKTILKRRPMHKFKFSIVLSLFIALSSPLFITSCDKKEEADLKSSNVVQTKWEDIEEKAPQKKSLKKELLSKKKKPSTIQKNLSSRTTSRYQLQFGAFINSKNADRLYRKMKRKGYSVIKETNRSDSQVWHTVRLKGFKTRLEAHKKAEKIAKKESIEVAILKNNSFNKIIPSPRQTLKTKTPKKISVVAKTKFTAPPTALKTKFVKPVRQKKIKEKYVGPLNYCFQVGGLLSAPVALAQRDKLKKKGYKAFIVKANDTMNKEEWSTVQIGYFQTLLKADQAALEFFKIENIPTKAREIGKD